MMTESLPARRVLVKPKELLGHEIDGKYTLESIIGGGGMGVVYRTTQPTLGRPLALKLLKFDDGTDDRVLRRFERELEIMSRLSHPNIVNVVEAGRDDETSLHYVVMERVDGVTLEHLLSRYRLKAELALDISLQICSALSEPHASGIVHRDVKPANIMVSIQSDGRVVVKLLDFGIARQIEVEGDAKITTTSTVIGSPAYMAPEAASGTDVDNRTDLYSFGVVLYEMLAGDVPFRGSTPVAIMLRHAVESPEPLSQRLPDFPFDGLSHLVDQLLEKDAEARPTTALQVLDAIEEVQKRYEFRAVRVSEIRSSVAESLADYLLARTNIPDEEVDDDYGPTQTFDSQRSDPVETFDGWMVPQTVVQKIDGGTAEVAPTTKPAESKPPIVGIAIVLILVLSVVGLFIAFSPPGNEVVELSDQKPEPKTDAVKEVAEKEKPASEEIAKTEPVDPKPVEEVVPTPIIEKPAELPKKKKVKTKPKEKPSEPKEEPKEAEKPKNDEINKGFEWLKNK